MILAIDIGTTFLKMGLIDYSGNFHFSEKRAIGLTSSNIEGEVDPGNWVRGLKELYSGLTIRDIESIESIVISGNGPTFIPVDSNGTPVGHGLSWLDKRSLSVSDEITGILGYSIPPNFFLGRAFWYKKERPDDYRITASFLSCPEYLCYLLTGNIYTLLTSEGFINLYWSRDKVEKLGLDYSKFPEFISPYEPYGNLGASSIFPGVKNGIPVICAGPDFTMSILGTGSVKEGIVCDRTGTSEGINFCSEKNLVFDNLRTLPHIVSGLYTIAGLIPESGEYVLSDRVDLLMEKYRSVINSIVENGLNIQEIRVIGGHAGLERINRLKAESFSFPLKIYPEGSDLVGNAVLGSYVLGKYPSIITACDNMVKEKICYNV